MKKATAVSPRHLLPLMMFLGVLIIGARFMDLWDVAFHGDIFQAVTPSQAATEPEKESVPEIHPPSMAAPQETAKTNETDKTAAAPTGASAGPALRRENDDPSLESELVKQLTERRNQLDQRARSLDSREALIKVAEQRVDQKIKEMETLRAQLQAMVNQAGAAQQTQIDNLVKIYETMKPKEAAKIFEALELPVLLGVIQKMKPARTAAVMAEMAPEKAKEITVALTKQDQLPPIK